MKDEHFCAKWVQIWWSDHIKLELYWICYQFNKCTKCTVLYSKLLSIWHELIPLASFVINVQYILEKSTVQALTWYDAV